MEIGNILREARIRRGLTIKDVEGATKIRSRYLEALENDDYAMLPGSTYVAAFLRTYAGFLKLDADELVEEYKRGHEPRSRDDSIVLRASSPKSGRGRGPGDRQRRKSRRNPRGYALVGILAVIVVVLLAWFGPGWGRESQTVTSMGLPNQETTTTILSEVSSTTTTPKPSTTTSTSELSGGSVTLLVTVTEGSCWMVVREDSASGAELFAGTLSAGGQKTFDSSKRYWMMVGQPDALTLAVNGRGIELPSEAGTYTVTEAGVQAAE